MGKEGEDSRSCTFLEGDKNDSCSDAWPGTGSRKIMRDFVTWILRVGKNKCVFMLELIAEAGERQWMTRAASARG